ncbi:hypothetical protein OIDMADRAFT_48950 [Oidiodendron maius Zn]|uniref:Aquaporin n=1 Tax=Oidiodendron maius (strain Zn) TaxID=913774 RepID=A0A0C3HLX3_OIDMZ|nr:hypothetical protein OIDMADRAFT_48950 [Oidiodendron maius Zn]
MESKDIPVDTIEGLRQRKGSTTKVELVKSPGAQFQGSFAAGARKKDWTKENESGGHLNPMITFTTLLTGLIEFPRAVLYVLAQVAGASLSGGLIRGGLGQVATLKYRGGGCFLESNRVDSVTLGQAFLLELSFALVSIFLAFALGLDPRQATLFSPTVGPALVGLSVGMLIFASAGLGFSGYSGPSFNPARCLAFSVARNNWDNQWIFWVAPMAASVIQSAMYHLVPPFRLLSSSEDKSS